MQTKLRMLAVEGFGLGERPTLFEAVRANRD